MKELLAVLGLLAEPIVAIVKLIEADQHTEADEQEVMFAVQRAIFNARAKRKFPDA